MLICTVSTASHLPKAACLAESLRKTQADHTVLLCLAERDQTGLGALREHFTDVVLASELNLPCFEALMFRYTALQACMAIKAQVVLWAMERFPKENYFVYLDSDTFAYSRFEELEFMVARSDILLTPHHVQDELPLERTVENMLRTLLFGIFNTGFVAVRRSAAAVGFLRWWNDKLERFCYQDESCGLFNEQRWLDLAPSFFDITIFREPGYNVANWNVATRCLRSSSFPPGYLVSGRPLRFFHFSMIDSGKDLFYLCHQLSNETPVLKMREEYAREVHALNVGGHSQLPWSYDFYSSGERITPEARRAYREVPELVNAVSNPFAQSNGIIHGLGAMV